jgi:chorismate mutase
MSGPDSEPMKRPDSVSGEVTEPLELGRRVVDALDEELVAGFAGVFQVMVERCRAVDELISPHKRESGLPPLQTERQAQVLRHVMAAAKEHGIPAEVAEGLWGVIHGYSVARQESAAEQNPPAGS